MKVKLIHVTPDAERLVGYIARVSNPDNQNNPDATKLIKYLIEHKHWSPFEMLGMCVEIQTSRAISAQIIRHRAFHFQEFSQRYSAVAEFEPVDIRLQDKKNRQGSLEAEQEFKDASTETIRVVLSFIEEGYQTLLRNGVAKEVARMILPMTSSTKIYMNGTLRDWIFYIQLRSSEHTQKEHREIALAIKDIFREQFPVISEAVFGAVPPPTDNLHEPLPMDLSNV